jgi:hypothetical protein
MIFSPLKSITAFWRSLVLGVLVLSLGAGLVYWLIKRTSQDAADAAQTLARRTSESIKETLGITPHVVVNGITVIEQTTPILELALLQQTIFKEYEWSHTFMGSTKRLVLRGEFVAKAGLNLQEPFSVAISTPSSATQGQSEQDTKQDTTLIRATLPRARLLSLELKTYIVSKDESGFWNHITPQDRQQAVAAMQQEVRSSVLQSGMLEQVYQEAERRIREAYRRSAQASPRMPTKLIIGGVEVQ